MATKDELFEQAQAAGLDVNSSMTKAELEEALAQSDAAGADPGVATDEQNAALQHTDDLRDQAAVGPTAREPEPEEGEEREGHSATTRDDPGDLGVPMLPGSPDEPVGPEDALGPGPKRGDYRDRIEGNPHHGAEPQRPHAEEIGDAEGEKGGVTTA